MNYNDNSNLSKYYISLYHEVNNDARGRVVCTILDSNGKVILKVDDKTSEPYGSNTVWSRKLIE